MVVKAVRQIPLVRGLAPLWASLLALWTVQTFIFGDYDSEGRHVWRDPASFAGLMLLMALHVATYIGGAIWQPTRWRYLAYSSLQTGIVCAIVLDRRSGLLAVALIVPLMVEAVGVLRPPRLLIAVLTEYLLVCCIALQLVGGWYLVRGILVIVLPLVAFALLAVVLVLRHLSARERPPSFVSFVQEREIAQRELAASIARMEALFSYSPRPAPAGTARRQREQLDLTEREREVLEYVARGERNKEIAFRLRVSESTIKAHLASAYAKLGVDSRAAAVAVALERHLLSSRSAGEP